MIHLLCKRPLRRRPSLGHKEGCLLPRGYYQVCLNSNHRRPRALPQTWRISPGPQTGEHPRVCAKRRHIDVFVANFGLATTSKMTAESCGTPHSADEPLFSESLVPRHEPYFTVEGDIWAHGCILAEMIGNVRHWSQATPEDNDYSYLMDRTVLFDMLPVSHSAYLLRKILSTKAQLRPSLAAIRADVLAMDTFFLSEAEAASFGWADRMEKLKMRKSRAARGVVMRMSSRRSSETSSSGYVRRPF